MVSATFWRVREKLNVTNLAVKRSEWPVLFGCVSSNRNSGSKYHFNLMKFRCLIAAKLLWCSLFRPWIIRPKSSAMVGWCISLSFNGCWLRYFSITQLLSGPNILINLLDVSDLSLNSLRVVATILQT